GSSRFGRTGLHLFHVGIDWGAQGCARYAPGPSALSPLATRSVRCITWRSRLAAHQPVVRCDAERLLLAAREWRHALYSAVTRSVRSRRVRVAPTRRGQP